MNELTIEVYEQYSTTAIIDNASALSSIVIESYETFYPGGIYGSALLYAPIDPALQWLIANPRPYRFIIRNGQNVVYEGWKLSDGRSYGGEPGYRFNLVGAFGHIGLRRDLRRLYADDRIDQSVWVWQTGASAAEKCDDDRNSRIRLTPKSVRDAAGAEVGWSTNDVAIVRYTAPTGEFIKRVTYDYDFQEGAQNWELIIRDVTNGTTINTYNTSGSGSGASATMGANCAIVDIRFTSLANQTPATDGTIYGQLSNIVVYAGTNNTAGYAATLGDVISDLRQEFSSEINAGTVYISANTQAIGTFITEGGGFEYVGDIFNRIGGLGDSSNNPWSAGFLSSERAASPDGKAVMYYEQQPDPTGSTFDYQLSLYGENIVGDPEIERNYDEIWNDIRVRYTDAGGVTRYRTSGDNASLTDSTSVARWGTRNITIDAGETTSTNADNYGIRFLKRHRYSEFKLPTPIQVRGYILGSSGEQIPASEIRAGKLVKINDFVSDNLASTGFNTIFLITQTSYNADDETCTIYTGRPEMFDVLTARREDKRAG